MRVRIVAPLVAQSTTWNVFIKKKKIQRRPMKYHFGYRWHVSSLVRDVSANSNGDLERAEDLQVPHSVAHTFAETVGVLGDKNIPVVFNPDYSSDLVPCNFSCRSQRRFQSAPELQEKQLAILHAILQRQFRRKIQKRRDLLHKLDKRQGAVAWENVNFVINSVRKLPNTPWSFFFFFKDLLHREYIKCVQG